MSQLSRLEYAKFCSTASTVLSRIQTSTIMSAGSFLLLSPLLNGMGAMVEQAVQWCLSLLITSGIHWTVQKIYQPKFYDRASMNTADWIDANIGSNRHWSTYSSEEYQSKKNFQIELWSFFLSMSVIMLYFVAMQSILGFPGKIGGEAGALVMKVFVLSALHLISMFGWSWLQQIIDPNIRENRAVPLHISLIVPQLITIVASTSLFWLLNFVVRV